MTRTTGDQCRSENEQKGERERFDPQRFCRRAETARPGWIEGSGRLHVASVTTHPQDDKGAKVTAREDLLEVPDRFPLHALLDPVSLRVMKALILFVGWCILFVLCWPVAIVALILFPIVWLISLPLRLVGVTIGAVFSLIKTLLFLPGRLLGWRKSV
jgi:hypothetical protein